MTVSNEKKRRYYEKLVYYRCNFCKRDGIFLYEENMCEHLLEKHRFKLDELDKIAFVRTYLGKPKLTKKDCLLYGIDFDRFKKYRKEMKK